MMTAAEIDYGTSRDGFVQLRRRWIPVDAPRAGVLLVHGKGEHSGRYERVGGRLADAGFLVVSIDNRGYGASGGDRGHVESFNHYLDDVEDQLVQLRALEIPLLLIGHSLGGLIVTAYCLDDRPAPDALVAIGPALSVDLRPAQRVMQLLGPLIRRMKPRHEIVDEWDASVFAEDLSVGEAFFHDPLRVAPATISMAMESLSAMKKVGKKLDHLDVPTLCLHGGRDRIVPASASEPLDGRPGVTRVVYPELGHEILNEPQGLDIVDEIVSWAEPVLGLDQ